MLRRLALTAVVSLAALATAVPASTASGPVSSGFPSSGPVPSAVPTTGPFAAARPSLGPLPLPVPPLPGFLDGGEGKGTGEANEVLTRLTVSVENTGVMRRRRHLRAGVRAHRGQPPAGAGRL